MFSSSDLAAIAQAVTSRVSFQQRGDYALSASEIFELLTSYLARAAVKNSDDLIALRLSQTPYGPSSAPPVLEKAIKVSGKQFLSTVLDVRDFLTVNHQIPNAVWLGSRSVAPQDYLVALAELSARLLRGGTLPDTVTIAPAQLVATEYIARDSVKLWDWPIFPDGFHSAHLMELARLQAWTLKPAIPISQPTSASASHP